MTGEAANPHRHRTLTGTLFVLATVIGVFAVLAVWVNRQALNTDNWTTTSTKLLADPEIQDAVGAFAVRELFDSGVPQAKVEALLPPKLEPLAGPATAGLQQIAGQLAPKVVAAPRFQAAWQAANRAAHANFLEIVNGGGSVASTEGGVVSLNLHELVSELGGALGLQAQVAAIQSKVRAKAGAIRGAAAQKGIKLPPSSGELVIMRASQLGAAQDVAGAIKGLALVLPILAFALFALAVWFSRGRRMKALRTVGWCFVGIGVFVLIVRRVVGNEVVNTLVVNPENKTAAHDVWTTATTLLHDIAVALVAYGLVFVAAAWLGGKTRLARAARRGLAPTLRDSPATGYIVAYAVLLLVVLWGPTPATRQLGYIIVFAALLTLGVYQLRRLTAQEFPDAQAGDAMHALRDWYAERRHPEPTAAAPASPVPTAVSHVEELERLVKLHDAGALTDSEFVTEKELVVHGS